MLSTNGLPRLLRPLRRPRLVIVTGAGSGIGRATALAFADRGATVIAVDVNEVTANDTAELIRRGGAVAHAYRLDVADAEVWEDFADTVRDEHGVPDVLVNNAGIAILGGMLEQSNADWERQLGVNLMGVIHGCRVIAPLMVQRGEGGHIVNIASAAAYLPAGFLGSYCVSKAGVRMLSECLRVELARDGIGVTAICPGGIATGIVGAADVITDVPEDKTQRFQAIASKYAQRYGPALGFNPALVARQIVRSVRYNWGVVPVRPESWLGYGLSRLAPGLVRVASQKVATGRRLQQLGHALELLDRFLPERVVDVVADADLDRPIDVVRDLVRAARQPAEPATTAAGS